MGESAEQLAELRERAHLLVAHMEGLREQQLPEVLAPLLDCVHGMGTCAGGLHALFLDIARHTVDMGGLPDQFDEERLLRSIHQAIRDAYQRGYREARGDAQARKPGWRRWRGRGELGDAIEGRGVWRTATHGRHDWRAMPSAGRCL